MHENIVNAWDGELCTKEHTDLALIDLVQQYFEGWAAMLPLGGLSAGAVVATV